MRKQYKTADELNWPNYVGKKIEKHSGRPFKSGFKTTKVLELTINPHTNKKAFLIEDGSIVDCCQCILVK